jgi:hypothetical protein
MKRNTFKLTLYQPETYQITVPGALDAGWISGATSLRITVEESVDGQPVSIITAQMDQAALQGLLRRLYSLGLPLISVIWIDGL